MPFLCFYITHPNEETAQKISQQLLKRKLVACTNQLPIQSAYWWEGAIAREGEVVTLAKTSLANRQAVMQAVEALHPYEVPCIVCWEVKANEAYEKWILDSVITQDPSLD